jgi:hypothetical protein
LAADEPNPPVFTLLPLLTPDELPPHDDDRPHDDDPPHDDRPDDQNDGPHPQPHDDRRYPDPDEPVARCSGGMGLPFSSYCCCGSGRGRIRQQQAVSITPPSSTRVTVRLIREPGERSDMAAPGYAMAA